MATAKYYDINSSMDKYDDSPSAKAYLQKVLDRSCPDAFHEADIEKARQLRNADSKIQMRIDRLRKVYDAAQDAMSIPDQTIQDGLWTIMEELQMLISPLELQLTENQQ